MTPQLRQQSWRPRPPPGTVSSWCLFFSLNLLSRVAGRRQLLFRGSPSPLARPVGFFLRVRKPLCSTLPPGGLALPAVRTGLAPPQLSPSRASSRGHLARPLPRGGPQPSKSGRRALLRPENLAFLDFSHSLAPHPIQPVSKPTWLCLQNVSRIHHFSHLTVTTPGNITVARALARPPAQSLSFAFCSPVTIQQLERFIK